MRCKSPKKTNKNFINGDQNFKMLIDHIKKLNNALKVDCMHQIAH